MTAYTRTDAADGGSPERRLWGTVALTALAEYRLIVTAEREGRKSVTIDGERLSARNAAARARRYFESDDWREVCSNAGVEITADQAMAYVETPQKERAA